MQRDMEEIMMIEIGIKAAANDKNMRKRDVLYGPHPKLNIMLSIGVYEAEGEVFLRS